MCPVKIQPGSGFKVSGAGGFFGKLTRKIESERKLGLKPYKKDIIEAVKGHASSIRRGGLSRMQLVSVKRKIKQKHPNIHKTQAWKEVTGVLDELKYGKEFSTKTPRAVSKSESAVRQVDMERRMRAQRRLAQIYNKRAVKGVAERLSVGEELKSAGQHFALGGQSTQSGVSVNQGGGAGASINEATTKVAMGVGESMEARRAAEMGGGIGGQNKNSLGIGIDKPSNIAPLTNNNFNKFKKQ